MCLTTRKKRGKIVKKEELISYFKEITKKEIVTYKYVDVVFDKIEMYRSKFIGFRYQDGIHYYQTNIKFGIVVSLDKNNLIISKGLHSYTKQKKCISGTCIKCIIPKGSECFRGTNNDIVSDNLIIVGKVK